MSDKKLNLNQAQQKAVDTIDGPLLVIAGPGTGKTQLLSARVAAILQKTDTLAQNILCLTFTENGASNMRERLTQFIGQSAYDVNIGTYHAFGGDLIQRYPEYFSDWRLQSPIDELGKSQILRNIVDSLQYDDPLKQTQHHLGDLVSTISELKRALLTPDDLRLIHQQNQKFLEQASKASVAAFTGFKRMPSKHAVAAPMFEKLLADLNNIDGGQTAAGIVQPLALLARSTLAEAVQLAAEAVKTNPLTAWKNSWLIKDSQNNFIFDGQLQTKRLLSIADVLNRYLGSLAARGLYDFDDMILQAIAVLSKNPDLRYTLQERYQYILLDEFQDTSPAQLKLIELLSDSPVHEGRPNVMAVGDDDQAIYAFQGATYSNMIDFVNMYRGVDLIYLTENYRSHQSIIDTAQNVSQQIAARLHHQFPGISKSLTASNSNLAKTADISRLELPSDIGQAEALASQVADLIAKGTLPSQIAVLAPKHRFLEPLVPYLNHHNVPVRYEKRENILEAPVVSQLITMSRLVLAIQGGNKAAANSLWPQVLSFDFWQLPTSFIWQLSWQIADSPDRSLHWSQLLLDSDQARHIGLLFLRLAGKADSESYETMLDYLIGSEAVEVHETDIASVVSPLRAHYTGPDILAANTTLFYETLSHLKVLRTRLRDYQATQDTTLKLVDFIHYVQLYEDADAKMINTSPHNQAADSVQLMTVFKAKGLEFEHVFLVDCHDNVWGASARGNSNKLTLPANLTAIRHAGATDDERLRILFVALTRAKIGLHLLSYSSTYAGKATKHLKYFDEQEQPDGNFIANILPPDCQKVVIGQADPPTLDQLEQNWKTRHTSNHDTQLADILAERIKQYRLSPTHLNSYFDTIYGGPQNFFFNSILRFPQAPGVAGQFGNAVHETLEWIQLQLNKFGALPGLPAALVYLSGRIDHKRFVAEQAPLQLQRGQRVIESYLANRGSFMQPGNIPEKSFKHEGVFIGDAHMSGKIDLLEIDTAAKTIVVVDYKTGKAFDHWDNSPKLHKYKQQLYCYKLLIENSSAYKGYNVTAGRLEFVEPSVDGQPQILPLNFNEEDLLRNRRLIEAMWARVMACDFPDISGYSQDIKGILAFEDAILAQ